MRNRVRPRKIKESTLSLISRIRAKNCNIISTPGKLSSKPIMAATFRLKHVAGVMIENPNFFLNHEAT